MRKFLSLVAIFIVCALGFVVGNQPTNAQLQTCHFFTSSTAIPLGFGAAYNVFSTTKELLITPVCQGTTINVTMGNGSNNVYVYESMYSWNGATWDQHALQGQKEGQWIAGNATGQFQAAPTQSGQPGYFVGFTCYWDGNNWKCGCRDAVCSQPFWQLQGYFAFQFPGGSSNGSSGGSSTSGGGSSTGGGTPGSAGFPGDIGGTFYGNYTTGDHTGNGRMFEHQGSRRFVAQKTGSVDAVTYENRVLLQYQIDDRFPKCKSGGLDTISCGYTMGGPYHVGNGGRICIELQTDDGTSKHLPSGNVIGEGKNCFTPIDLKDKHFPAHELKQPAQVEAGKIYHLVLNQTAPPGNCRSGHSVSQAKSCPRNKGLISFNGTYHSAGLPKNPYGGAIEANLTRDSAGDSWRKDGEELAFYGLRYADDKAWYGNLYTFYRGYYTSSPNGNHIIGGSKRVRQKFTVKGKSYRANGMWIRAARRGNGSLRVEVKNNSGTVLASGSFNANEFPNNCGSRCSGDFGHTDFGKTIDLQEGQTYTAEFIGSNISLQTGFPLDYGGFAIPGPGGSTWWSDAQAEVSTNNGGSWSGFSGNYYPKRDLSLLFTLEGQPKSYLQ